MNAQITLFDDLKTIPGLRPITVVKNKKKEAEFIVHLRSGDLKANELNALHGEAFDMKVGKNGQVLLRHPNGMIVHSVMRKDEWKELDRDVVDAVRAELNGVQALRGRGLVQMLGGIGTQVTQISVASERTAASVTMSGRAQGNRDRVDKVMRQIPVPLIHAEYEIGIRELTASRTTGDALDTTEQRAAGAVVGEKIEEILFDGDASIVVEGDGIVGLTNHSGRDTDTATNYGGGDWGTAGNGAKTILGMISALKALFYRGPFGVFVANTQYFQAQTPNANRSGNDLTDILEIPGVEFAEPSDWLTDENVLLVSLSKNVIDLAIALEVQNRQWNAQDDMAFYGKVMASIIPRVKQDYAGNVGIAHATGA